jgi:enoyl-CoA hydratase/carnithine racemase
MNYDHYQFLTVEKQGGIAVLTMNRPERRNALPADGQIELETIWLDLARDQTVNVIVLTGAGKAISAGGDLKEMAAMCGSNEGFRRTLHAPGRAGRLLNNILDVSQPIIAAVNGDAIGLGATLALFADTCVIADDAKFGDTHVKVGLVAGDGGTVIWPLLVGVNLAKEFLMLGRTVSGAECVRMGLLNHSVPRECVMDKAMEIARDLAASAPWAVRWTKLSINKAIKAQLNLLLDSALAFEMLTMNTQDHFEAASAILERRSPHFMGY